MQRPAPAGGGIVKTGCFKRYVEADLPKTFDRIIQSWDTAATIRQLSDFSVCTTWGRLDKQTYLLDVFRKRLTFPDLKRAIVDHARLHNPEEIYIEGQSSGIDLIRDLQRDGFSRIHAHKPRGNKQMRMAGQTPQIENGLVYVPQEAHWLADYLHELSVFPNGRFDDQVDSTSQALDALGDPQIKGFAFLEMARRNNAARRAERGEVTYDTEPDWAIGSMEWKAKQERLAAEKAAQMAADAAAEAAAPPKPVIPQVKPEFVPTMSKWQPGCMEWAADQAANAKAKEAHDASWA
jgi:predicted phage terminase large subunit-like protein